MRSPPFQRPVPKSRAPRARMFSLIQSRKYLFSNTTTKGRSTRAKAAGTAGLIKYIYQAVTTPPKANQKGAEVSACTAIATGPWKASPSSCITGCLSALTTIASLKNSPNSMGSIVKKPITTEGIASITSGTHTTQGDSCGAWCSS